MRTEAVPASKAFCQNGPEGMELVITDSSLPLFFCMGCHRLLLRCRVRLGDSFMNKS